jgi:hypothetical protein
MQLHVLNENQAASSYRNAAGVCFVPCRMKVTEVVLPATSGVIPCYGLLSE